MIAHAVAPVLRPDRILFAHVWDLQSHGGRATGIDVWIAFAGGEQDIGLFFIL